MFQELNHQPATTNMVGYIDAVQETDTTTINTTPSKSNLQEGIDVVDLYPSVDVKVRKGEYIIKMAKTNTDQLSFEHCFETALKRIVLLAFKKEAKPKPKRKTIIDMTPEQIEKARQQRLDWYRKNKGKVREYTRDKYNTNYDFWKKTTDYARERYRASHANIEKMKPGRKPRSASNSGDESQTSQHIARRRGRPRIHPISETKERRPPGRPVKVKFFTTATPTL